MVSLEGLNVVPGSPNSISTTATSTITISALPGTDLWLSAEWMRTYDHGGLVFYFNSPGEQYQSWIKTGIEMFEGEPHVATAATPSGGYADLSLVPTGGKSATIEVIAQQPSLKVYLVEGEKKRMIRQATWVFQENQDLVLGVGVFAARPTKVEREEAGQGEVLVVSFEGLEIEWID